MCYLDLNIDSVTNPTLREMGCCGAYIHGRCYEQLRSRNQSCGMCRGTLVEQVERVEPVACVASQPVDVRREMALASIEEYIRGAHRFREFPNVSGLFVFNVI